MSQAKEAGLASVGEVGSDSFLGRETRCKSPGIMGKKPKNGGQQAHRKNGIKEIAEPLNIRQIMRSFWVKRDAKNDACHSIPS